MYIQVAPSSIASMTHSLWAATQSCDRDESFLELRANSYHLKPSYEEFCDVLGMAR